MKENILLYWIWPFISLLLMAALILFSSWNYSPPHTRARKRQNTLPWQRCKLSTFSLCRTIQKLSSSFDFKSKEKIPYLNHSWVIYLPTPDWCEIRWALPLLVTLLSLTLCSPALIYKGLLSLDYLTTIHKCCSPVVWTLLIVNLIHIA